MATELPYDGPSQGDNESNIKAGTYSMRALEADLGLTGKEGDAERKPQVGVLLQFEDGPHAGLTLTWHSYFTEPTKVNTIRALRTLGWQGNDLCDLSTVRGSAPCVVINETYEGVTRAKVRFIGGGSLALKTVMPDAQKKAFAANLMGLAASIPAIASKEKAAPPNGAASKKRDDDIPF